MKTLQFLLIALVLFATQAQAQIQAAPTVINMDVNATIDEIGNGEVKLTIKMSAMQWAEWKKEYGNNPSLFKRDISKQFNQIEVTDFKLDQDDMKRQAVVTIHGKGMAIYQGRDVYEVELDGEMTGGDLVDDEFRVTYTEPQGPSVLTLIDQRVRLPKGAKNIKVTKNSQGEDVLRYELSGPSRGLPWGWIGIVLALVGGGLFFSAGSDSRAA